MTVVYLTENALKKSFKAFGFKSYDSETISLFNKVLHNFVENQLKKGINNHHGGRIVLPLEYFGVDTNHYVAHPEYTSMGVTENFIRPPMEMQNASWNDVQTGGTARFAVPLKAVESAIEEVSTKHSKEVYRKMKTAKAIQNKFEKIATEIMGKVKKTSESQEHLSIQNLHKITGMKKYKSLH